MAKSEEFQDDPPPKRPRPPEDFDDEPRPRRRRRPDDDDDDYDVRRPDDGVSSLIPYKNPKALVAYYCGVFSLIPCFGLVLGPIALIFGILGLRYAKRYPTAKGGGHAIAGIVLGIISSLGNWGIVLLALAGGVASGFK